MREGGRERGRKERNEGGREEGNGGQMEGGEERRGGEKGGRDVVQKRQS